MSILLNLVGQRFGRLLVLREAARSESRPHERRWFCRCDCGTEKSVSHQSLRGGKTVSCGCFNKEHLGNHRRTHGRSKTKIWNRWTSMNQRCYDPNFKNYSLWGGRGITVCARWRGVNGFANFLADMGELPSPKHQIERVDNDGNYCPENCKWDTQANQAMNKRSNRNVTANGETHCVMEWSRIRDINRRTIAQRLDNGDTPEEALGFKERTRRKHEATN